ncbi:OLC1v1013097C1 [Oldenlandia corymbosa var. corymbosa]|uniref:OLC1v1013097C1 n=1 Tax=Oldenlandia corymbosa var. corymbosa TaxID=529605 RepID=A0AAV1DZX8_OLDCO|nr:OLC1v1013097C1 [Oldenlandia corymbosa var. corymbosa]
MTRPSVARFCVEADLTKEFPKFVRIGKKGRKHEQHFTYEHIPSYRSKCSKIGHKKEECKKELAPQPFLVVKQNEVVKVSDPGKKGKGIVMKTPKPKWKPQCTVISDCDAPKQSNRFSALETIVEYEDEVEEVFSEAPLLTQEKKVHASVASIDERSLPVASLDSAGKIIVQEDTQVEYHHEDDSDDELNGQQWSLVGGGKGGCIG